MAGNGGLDGRSAQSLVGCCDDETRIFLFSFSFYFVFICFSFASKLSSACDGAHITVEYNDKRRSFPFSSVPYGIHRNYFPQLQSRIMIGTSKNKVQEKF